MEDNEKELWKQHKQDMTNMRRRRQDTFREVIKEFRRMGFEVKELTPFQIRFNDCIDVYPSNKRFHDLKNNVRGDIRGKKFSDFLRNYFNIR